MNLLPGVVADLLYLLAAMSFIVALKAMSRPPTARRGNQIGAAGAALAVVTVFLSNDIGATKSLLILAALLLGSAIAIPVARFVPMTGMPQLVAILNGVGGFATVIVGLLELAEETGGITFLSRAAISFIILVGSLSLTGSLLTYLKLQGIMPASPIVIRSAGTVMIAVMAASALTMLIVALTGSLVWGIVLVVFGLASGVLMLLPIGGADAPVTIVLLNAMTGLSVAASGVALENTLLLVSGMLVGCSGSILTLTMARAMGRSVQGIMLGSLAGGSTAGLTQESERPVRRATPDDVAVALAYASKIVVVPGYGMAVAQAQNVLAELVTALRERGVEATCGIHPVAGRMPGHMNVLLAEANVGYELLVEADDVNPQLPATDVVLVVGANDVVNPAARDDPASSIYGMPIIQADQARQVFFLKRSMRPGFAGIENELLFNPKTQLLFGDAKDSLGAVVSALKEV